MVGLGVGEVGAGLRRGVVELPRAWGLLRESAARLLARGALGGLEGLGRLLLCRGLLRGGLETVAWLLGVGEDPGGWLPGLPLGRLGVQGRHCGGCWGHLRRRGARTRAARYRCVARWGLCPIFGGLPEGWLACRVGAL